MSLNSTITALGNSIINLVNKRAKVDLSNISSDGENVIKEIAGGSGSSGASRNIGEIISSTLPLTDAGLHLLDGTLLPYGVYKEFIDYIADLYAENPDANYWTTESDWQDSVTRYGVCGKFVYDSVNNTVRLPKITGIIEGTTDENALGDLVEAGLPNITGYFNASTANSGTGTDGCFYNTANWSEGQNYWSGINNQNNSTYRIDASRSSSIYGNSSTVQPQTIKVLYYIVVATTSKTEIQSDIDEIATDLNGKADVDLSNINASQSAKDTIIGWGMPDWNNSISYANNTNTNTAPSDGFIILNYAPNAVSGTAGTLQINGQNVASGLMQNVYRAPINGMFVINKNDTFKITAVAVNDNGTPFIYKFIPMKGVN